MSDRMDVWAVNLDIGPNTVTLAVCRTLEDAKQLASTMRTKVTSEWEQDDDPDTWFAQAGGCVHDCYRIERFGLWP